MYAIVFNLPGRSCSALYLIRITILSFFLMSFTGYAVKLSSEKRSSKIEEFITEQKLFANDKKMISRNTSELKIDEQERSKRFFLYQNNN